MHRVRFETFYANMRSLLKTGPFFLYLDLLTYYCGVQLDVDFLIYFTSSKKRHLLVVISMASWTDFMSESLVL